MCIGGMCIGSAGCIDAGGGVWIAAGVIGGGVWGVDLACSGCGGEWCIGAGGNAACTGRGVGVGGGGATDGGARRGGGTRSGVIAPLGGGHANPAGRSAGEGAGAVEPGGGGSEPSADVSLVMWIVWASDVSIPADSESSGLGAMIDASGPSGEIDGGGGGNSSPSVGDGIAGGSAFASRRRGAGANRSGVGGGKVSAASSISASKLISIASMLASIFKASPPSPSMPSPSMPSPSMDRSSDSTGNRSAVGAGGMSCCGGGPPMASSSIRRSASRIRNVFGRCTFSGWVGGRYSIRNRPGPGFANPKNARSPAMPPP